MKKRILFIVFVLLTQYLPAQIEINPRIFAEGIISTGDYDTHPCFSPAGDTLFFVKCAPDFSTWTICVSYLINNKWSEPEVAVFSGKYMDADPFFSKDGNTLYFISDRPVTPEDTGKTDSDIWKVVKTAEGWSDPVHLEPPVNSSGDEYYPTFSDNGTLYFGSNREGGAGTSDLYRSKPENGNYSSVENLGDKINTPDNEYEPFIASDESFLVFMATHPQGLRNADLYISFNNNGVWTAPEKMPGLFNSDATEFSPKITLDGKKFFFSSTRNINKSHLANKENSELLHKRIRSAGNGLGDIYVLDISDFKKAIQILKGKK